MTALILAAEMKDGGAKVVEVGKYLVENGADFCSGSVEDVEQISGDMNRGHNALTIAAEVGFHDFVKMLLTSKKERDWGTCGVDWVNAKNWVGKTALINAAEFGHESIVKLLLEDNRTSGVARSKRGMTALMLACLKDRKAIVEQLLHDDRGEVLFKSERSSTQSFDYPWEVVRTVSLFTVSTCPFFNMILLLLVLTGIYTRV